MENQGVCCDVKCCVHNVGEDKCSLPEIKVTEQCQNIQQKMDDPHYCQSFCKRGAAF